jgi:hypothetical protein
VSAVPAAAGPRRPAVGSIRVAAADARRALVRHQLTPAPLDGVDGVALPRGLDRPTRALWQAAVAEAAAPVGT